MPIPPTEYEPSLAGMVSRAIERRLLSLHTCIPARVERWDSAKGLIDAQPLVMAYKRAPDGTAQPYTLAVATNVPALFIGGGGGPGEGFRGTYPVQPGDLALLFAAEASMDKWLERGDLVDPEDQRRHNLSDGIALVGLRPAVSPWTGVLADAATWGKDGGLQIHITVNQIKLGGADATHDVATAQKVETELGNLKSILLDTIVGAGSASFVDAGVTFKLALEAALAAWPGTTASSAVKVKP